MGEHKNLGGDEAIKKMKALIDGENICMFATRLKQQPIDVRPMGTSQVEEDGKIWFMSKADSTKNADIEQDSSVQLFYANKSSAEYLSIYGEATISKDQSKIDELWSPLAKAWFEKGKDDPTISLICVRPLDVYYWDTKTNKLVTLIKIASAALTGKTADGGVEGALELNLQK